MNRELSSFLCSSNKLEWSSAHSNLTEEPSSFTGRYRQICLQMSWSYSDLLQGVSARGWIRLEAGVIDFAMLISLDIVIFLALSSCCLIRYADTWLLGRGGKYGRGGGEGMGISSLCHSRMWHITRLDGSSL